MATCIRSALVLLPALVAFRNASATEVAPTLTPTAAPAAEIVIRVNQLGYLPGVRRPPSRVSVSPCDRHRGGCARASGTLVEDTTGRVVQKSQNAGRRARFGRARPRIAWISPPCAHRPLSNRVPDPRDHRSCASMPARTPAPPTRSSTTCAAALGLQPDAPRLRSRTRRHHRRSTTTRTGEFINVSGGWADAADYLQYVTTSATATYVMLKARGRLTRWRSSTTFAANGLPGANGVRRRAR
jgi:hypothetical protein